MKKKQNDMLKQSKNEWNVPDDAPFLNDDFFDNAEIIKDNVVIQKMKRGRPKLKNPKQPISIRLNAELVKKLKKSGRGWQTRIDKILCKEFGIE